MTSQWTAEPAQEQPAGRALQWEEHRWQSLVAGRQLQEAVGVGGGEPRGTHGRKPGPEEGPGNGRSEGPGMSGVGWHHAALLTYSTSLGRGPGETRLGEKPQASGSSKEEGRGEQCWLQAGVGPRATQWVAL